MTKKEKIKKLLDLAGINKNYLVLFMQGVNVASERYSMLEDVSTEEIKEIEMRCLDKATSMKSQIINEIADIYERHFSEKEIDALLVFHESSIGRKMVEIFPVLNKEMLEICLMYSERMQKEVVTDIKNEEK